MTTTTTERTQTDWTQAREENKQRAARVREILKAAALETFSEVKAGSADLNVLTRQSMDAWLEEQVAATTKSAGETVSVQPTVATDTEGKAAIPTWRELILRSLGIVRDRKADWFQQFRTHLKEQAAKFDADMTEAKGDSYSKAKSLFQRLVTWVESNRHQDTHATPSEESQPVSIEVIDESGTVVNLEQKVQ
ncbi:MAG: hypothetical protein AAFQ89_00840 [Cyanobacteria bacterium J06626_18]